MDNYTKVFGVLAQQLQHKMVLASANMSSVHTSLRLSRNVWICAGATAAACVAVGAALNMMKRRKREKRNGRPGSIDEAKLEMEPIGVNWRRFNDYDIESDTECDEPLLQISDNRQPN